MQCLHAPVESEYGHRALARPLDVLKILLIFITIKGFFVRKNVTNWGFTVFINKYFVI
jgi:hypothetical protein